MSQDADMLEMKVFLDQLERNLNLSREIQGKTCTIINIHEFIMYVFNLAPADDCERLQSHLVDCAECGRFLRVLRQAIEKVIPRPTA